MKGKHLTKSVNEIISSWMIKEDLRILGKRYSADDAENILKDIESAIIQAYHLGYNEALDKVSEAIKKVK
jgi:hypothetical protein